MRSVALALFVGMLHAGCGSGAPLSVDLRTDWVPAREFVRVEVTLATSDDAGPSSVHHAAHNVSTSGDYLEGVRVAEIGGLAQGDYVLRVALLDAHASEVASRRVDVTVTGHTSVTVVMTRNCHGVTCPRGGDPSLTECVDDRCVDPRCSPLTPTFCPTPGCMQDRDCTANGCGRASCADGTCLVAPDDSHCASGMICSIDLSCVPDDSMTGADGGLGLDAFAHPTGETSCTNGVDDDLDGATDCADGECAGAGCDDGNACTASDTCRGGTCAGDGVTCTSDACVTRACNGTPGCAVSNTGFATPCPDDGNPCTIDLCDGNGGCGHVAQTDGTQCGTGEFHCCGGVCVDVTSDRANCGACGVHCVTDHPCMRIPTTNFGTCGCTAPYDSACAGYGPGAWCSPGGRCQCTCGCPTSGPCDQTCRACGGGTATCRDINGMDNWCYY